MENKNKSRKTFKIILIILLVILIIVTIVVAIINILKPTDALKGSFIYREYVKYEFNGKGKGVMYDNNAKYPYSYSIDESTLRINFNDETVMDASYTFALDNNTLTLIGKEGTMGGEYILERESK